MGRRKSVKGWRGARADCGPGSPETPACVLSRAGSPCGDLIGGGKRVLGPGWGAANAGVSGVWTSVLGGRAHKQS